MALPTSTLLRYTFGGSLPGSEKWRCSVWYRLPGGIPSDADLQTCIVALGTSFRVNFVAAASNPYKSFGMNTATTWDVHSINVYDGGNLVKQVVEQGIGTPQTGTVGVASPNYTAMCITTLSTGFGRSSRGRIYLPFTANVNAATGAMGTNQTHIDNFRNALNNVGGAPPFSVVPTIVSRTTTSTHDITRVRLDNRPDTQRGRIKQMSGLTQVSSTL